MRAIGHALAGRFHQSQAGTTRRGLTIEEAEPLLARAIDDAVLADLPYLRIIHGKGTGVLRDFVQGVVKRDKRIKSYGLAPAMCWPWMSMTSGWRSCVSWEPPQ